MIIQLVENIRAGKVLNKRQLEKLSDALSILKAETGIEVVFSANLYEAVSNEEAMKALDCAIQGYDVHITKDEYNSMLKELSDDIYNQEDGFEELTCLANDMAEDILKRYNKI